MCRPWFRVTFLSLLALMPSMFSIILLWYFDSLNRGGPLIIVLLVSGLGWYVTQLIKIGHNRSETGQIVTHSDPPPKYEKVVNEPPPYEALYSEKPQSKEFTDRDRQTNTLDKRRPSYRLSDTETTMSMGNTSFFPPEPSGHRILTGGASGTVNETLINEEVYESDCVTVIVGDDGGHDPELPSYQDAVKIGSFL